MAFVVVDKLCRISFVCDADASALLFTSVASVLTSSIASAVSCTAVADASAPVEICFTVDAIPSAFLLPRLPHRIAE